MDFLQLISQFFQFLASWFPRLARIDVRHRGVRFVRGKDATLSPPGMRVFWPLTTDLTVWPVISQTVVLESQSLRTADHLTVAIKLRILYTVPDPVLLLVSLQEPDDSLKDLALGAATEVICENSLDDLTSDIRRTNRELLLATRRTLKRVGVQVELAQLASISPAIVLQHFGELPLAIPEGE